jgi:hypothetical protein
MWLLNVSNLELRLFLDSAVPKYAILSHTWGQQEVTFTDLYESSTRAVTRQMQGFDKIHSCCLQAAKDGYEWVWIDSCCIDKRSSAELSEAIISMFKYYQQSACCYVYLADLSLDKKLAEDIEDGEDIFQRCRWFKRGWTLQELIAPLRIKFFARDWTCIGLKTTTDKLSAEFESSFFVKFCRQISRTTRIPEGVLTLKTDPREVSVASRMSWAACRETTREEDRAYCLMGLFDVYIPILYGEGLSKAFQRLQLEIIKTIPDESIFAWTNNGSSVVGLLATTPDRFEYSNGVEVSPRGFQIRPPFSMTNIGLSINLPLSPAKLDPSYGECYIAELDCSIPHRNNDRSRLKLAIMVMRCFVGNDSAWMRINCDKLIFDHAPNNGVRTLLIFPTKEQYNTIYGPFRIR